MLVRSNVLQTPFNCHFIFAAIQSKTHVHLATFDREKVRRLTQPKNQLKLKSTPKIKEEEEEDNPPLLSL
jgi:hypothetical protein